MYNRTRLSLLLELDQDKGSEELIKILSKFNGNISRSAKALGISRSTLKRWVSILHGNGYDIRSQIRELRNS